MKLISKSSESYAQDVFAASVSTITSEAPASSLILLLDKRLKTNSRVSGSGYFYDSNHDHDVKLIIQPSLATKNCLSRKNIHIPRLILVTSLRLSTESKSS